MRIVTYNTQFGFANGRKVYDMEAQAEHLASYDADVIALQEVAIRHPLGKPIDYPTEVAKVLGMNYLFAEAMPLKPDGHYGVAILSKYPIEHIATLSLPVPSKDIEPRVALVGHVKAPQPFYMISTHLSYQGEFVNDDQGRVKQMEYILDYLKAHLLSPIVLAGDLNTSPNAPVADLLRQSFLILNDGHDEPTCKTGKYGWLQIDFIAVSPSSDFICKKFRVGDNCQASDHYAVIADVELRSLTM